MDIGKRNFKLNKENQASVNSTETRSEEPLSPGKLLKKASTK
jgi:hypothetical protein